MNKIILHGQLRNIQHSHTIGNIEYEKADLIVKRNNNTEDDVITLKYRTFNNIYYKEGDIIDISGNIRSYSQKINKDKNKVNVYVFTFFDMPENEDLGKTNEVILTGRVCKKEDMRFTKSGKSNIHFILANNIISQDSNQKLNSYIPCVVWGKWAEEFKSVKVSDELKIYGQLHTRTYTKQLDNGEIEYRTATEVVVLKYEIL